MEYLTQIYELNIFEFTGIIVAALLFNFVIYLLLDK